MDIVVRHRESWHNDGPPWPHFVTRSFPFKYRSIDPCIRSPTKLSILAAYCIFISDWRVCTLQIVACGTWRSLVVMGNKIIRPFTKQTRRDWWDAPDVFAENRSLILVLIVEALHFWFSIPLRPLSLDWCTKKEAFKRRCAISKPALYFCRVCHREQQLVETACKKSNVNNITQYQLDLNQWVRFPYEFSSGSAQMTYLVCDFVNVSLNPTDCMAVYPVLITLVYVCLFLCNAYSEPISSWQMHRWSSAVNVLSHQWIMELTSTSLWFI